MLAALLLTLTAIVPTGRKAEACATLASIVGLDGSRAEAARRASEAYCDEAGSAP